MPLSEISKLPSSSLKDILSTLDLGEETKRVLKEDQKIWELQRNLHQQTICSAVRVDMTKDMSYSINDTVCLWECENLRGSLDDQTLVVMEAFDVGISQAMSFTLNQINQLEINKLRSERALPYLIRPLENNENKITGAYTNNA
jgi:hypothetical protein